MPSPADPGRPARLRYAHVLVDFDRTLNDSDAVYAKNLDGFLGLTGRQLFALWECVHRRVLRTAPKRHEDLDFHYELMLKTLRQRGDVKAVKKEMRSRIRRAQKECWRATALFDESVTFLRRMKDAGYVLHLATGDYARMKAEHIEAQAGARLFDGAFDEETLGVGKGKRDYFDRAVQRLGAAPSDVAIVGDSLRNDIRPAIEAGLATIWIRRRAERDRARLRPNLVAGSLMEALPYFLET